MSEGEYLATAHLKLTNLPPKVRVVDKIEVLSGCLSAFFMLYNVFTPRVCISLTAAERLEKSLNE